MTDTEVKATVDREQRTDRAERTLSVEGAPPLSYETRISYRNRKLKTVHWMPRTVRLTWDHGILRTVHVRGFKLKADGTEGLLKYQISFPVESSASVGHVPEYVVLRTRTPDTSYDSDHYTSPPAWLVQLVEDHKIVPPFKSLAEVGA
jgi:hypothetical protein